MTLEHQIDLISMRAAVREEMAAAQDKKRTAWLEIDGIEHLADTAGNFVYRLALSSPAPFSADQTVTFHTRNPTDTIPAVIIRSDDDSLTVECQKPLPTDAKLLSLSFDPAFILRALEEFVLHTASQGGGPAALVAARTVPALPAVEPGRFAGLNEEQSRAVTQMDQVPLHLLWGPPGTGKTTTLGVAIARWLRQRQRVLVVSTSNAAVDVAMRAVLKNLRPDEQRFLWRLGSSLDPQVRPITTGGKWAVCGSSRATAVVAAQQRLREIRELLQQRNLPHDRRHALFVEAQRHEADLTAFHAEAVAAIPQLSRDVLVIGCTLAKMVLDAELRTRSFDVVVVDEASMASLLYALAASFLATDRVVYAGDPKQLPPIVQSKGDNAARWFGQNIYDWLGIGTGKNMQTDRLSLLQAQYRMTDQIGDVVSRLSYGGLLRHGRGTTGPTIQFIDVDGDWQTTSYSVREESYYHLAAVPLLHALAKTIRHEEVLFLTPFRAQRSLLAALAFDLGSLDPRRKITASTIHRAQGSEANAVVVDLTAYSAQRQVAFFRDRHCERLLNVAVSRARDQLVILGSRAMLRELARTMPFWAQVVAELGNGMDVTPCAGVIADLSQYDHLAAVPLRGQEGMPALYCHHPGLGSVCPGSGRLRGLAASRKLLVVPGRDADQVGAGDFIVRTCSTTPPVFVAGGVVCIPYRGKWLAVNSPNVSRVIWRIGFAHLAEEDVDPANVRRFFCPNCADGDLVLCRGPGQEWSLACTNTQNRRCHYRTRLSLEDAKVLVRLQGMRCRRGHPFTARQRGASIFLGCENYPFCDVTASLALLRGV